MGYELNNPLEVDFFDEAEDEEVLDPDEDEEDEEEEEEENEEEDEEEKEDS